MRARRTLTPLLTGGALAVLATGCGGVAPVAERTPAPAPASSISSAAAGSPSPSPARAPTTSGARRTPSAAPHRTTTAAPHTTAFPTPTSASTLPRGLLGRVITRVPTTRRIAALTFDCGGNGDGVTSILTTLRRERLPAAFFMTGRFAAQFPALARQITAAGVVGNHTVTHPHMTRLSDARVRDEILGARSTIRQATGVDTKPWFRFPFGESDARTVRIVNGLGFLPIGWTYGSPGYLGTSGGVTVDTVVSRMTATTQPGEILLLHVGSNPDDHTTLDADALPRIIARLRAAGFTFVSVKTLLG